MANGEQRQPTSFFNEMDSAPRPVAGLGGAAGLAIGALLWNNSQSGPKFQTVQHEHEGGPLVAINYVGVRGATMAVPTHESGLVENTEHVIDMAGGMTVGLVTALAIYAGAKRLIQRRPKPTLR